MSATKRGTARLGLAVLAVLGLMGLMAVGAQANWLVLLAGVPTVIPNNTEVAASGHTHLIFLIPAKNLEILCAKTTSDDFLLRTVPLGFAEGSLLLSECKTYSTAGGVLTAVPKCDPINQPIKATFTAQLILHTGAGNDGHNYILIGPGLNSTKIKTFEFSEECALTATSDLKGSFVAECGHLNGSGVFVHLDCINHQVTQLIRQAPVALFPNDKLIYGLISPATIDGILALKLIGPHAGLPWGGHV